VILGRIIRALRIVALAACGVAVVLLVTRSGNAAPVRGIAHNGPATEEPAIVTATATPLGTPGGTVLLSVTATVALTPTALADAPVAATASAGTSPTPAPWAIRSVDTMKLSRDTRAKPLTDTQIAALVRLDVRLHLTHITVDVYYDDPAYMARWVRAIRAVHLHVWFRAHWYAWETHREKHGDMTPDAYIEATRQFLQQHVDLVQNGDIFDFCPEPENGAYWFDRYGDGWSWRDAAAKKEFNSFVRSGVYMASTTLANRGRSQVLVTAISVNESIATRLFSKPTAARLELITLDLYPEGGATDPAVATARLLAEIERVHQHWNLPILIGEHGYSRDRAVSDAIQARVLAAELAALARLPYLRGLNYWVDAGGPRYGGYTNLYAQKHGAWQPRPAAAVLAAAYAAMAR
jgi:hypothetical protein